MELGNVYLSKLSKLSGYRARVENTSLDEGLQMTAPGSDPVHSLLVHGHAFFSLSVCGCLYTVTEELSGDTEAI